MKTNKIRIMAVVLVALLAVGCQKDEISFYDSRYDAIRFPASNISILEPKGYDTSTGLFHTGFSFIDNPFLEYAVYDIPLVLVGKRADYDRKINYNIDMEKSSAPTGSYEILESIIPADSIAGYIRIKMYNVEALNEEVYELYITLLVSGELSLANVKYTSAVFSWHNNFPAPTTSGLIRTYNYLISSPANYNSTSMAYFSPNALKVIVDAFGWNDWDDYEIYGPNYNNNGYKYLPRSDVLTGSNQYKSYAVKLGVYIKTYNEAHPKAPFLHNAGELKGEPIMARIYDN